jgi:small subunit ribosomal protein S4
MMRQKAKFETPHRPWVAEAIERDREVINSYGLRRKKEIWRAEAILREWRRKARELAASKNAEEERILLTKLHKLGLVREKANLDEVLGLELPNLLERRLQTLVFRKGFATTPNQARQFIVHGHIAVGGIKIIWPSMIVPAHLEGDINFYDKSAVKAWLMAAKAKQVEKEKAKVAGKEVKMEAPKAEAMPHEAKK